MRSPKNGEISVKPKSLAEKSGTEIVHQKTREKRFEEDERAAETRSEQDDLDYTV